jgi:hypothetical protein
MVHGGFDRKPFRTVMMQLWAGTGKSRRALLHPFTMTAAADAADDAGTGAGRQDCGLAAAGWLPECARSFPCAERL